MQIDAEAIRELARLLEETGLAEIEISEKDFRIRVARPQAPALIAAAPAPVAGLAGPMSSPVAVPAAPATDPDWPVGADHPGALKSPMVGVAWLRPDPNTKPFIQPGERVAEGQTVLLIEAMKTFNQIKAHRAGTVTRVLVADGAPVEYAEVLLLIE